MQVYFIDDPLDPDWKVVRYKDPRSARVTGGVTEATLSAPGREDATHIGQSSYEDDGSGDRPHEPVLEADVVHVVAHEEMDEEAAYMEEDHVEPESDDDTGPVGGAASANARDAEEPVHVRDVIDDN